MPILPPLRPGSLAGKANTARLAQRTINNNGYDEYYHHGHGALPWFSWIGSAFTNFSYRILVSTLIKPHHTVIISALIILYGCKVVCCSNSRLRIMRRNRTYLTLPSTTHLTPKYSSTNQIFYHFPHAHAPNLLVRQLIIYT